MRAAVPSIPAGRPWFYTAVIAVMGICALLVASGSPVLIGAAAVLLLLVPLLYLAFSKPLILPYGLYVLLVPFDNVLTVAHNVTVTRLLGIAAGIAILAWSIRHRRLVQPDLSLAALGALAIWMLASILWSVDAQASLAILPTYGGLILLYGAIATMPLDRREFRTLLALALFSGVLAALYGEYTFYHNPALLTLKLAQQRLFVDPNQNGSPIDPNHFANSLLLPCAILVAIALRSGFLKKIFAGVCLAVVIVAVAMSASREAALGVLLILMYFALRSRHRAQLILVAAGIIVIGVRAPSALLLRFATQGSQRSAIWSVGWEAFKHRPLQGYGIGSFISAYDTYYLSVAQTFSNGFSSPPHNLVVHYGVEIGLIGMLLIGCFFYAMFRSLRCIGPESDLYEDRVMLEAALLSIVLVSMFIDLFTMKYAWLVFALVAQLRSVYLTRSDASAQVVHKGVTRIELPDEAPPALAAGSPGLLT